MGKNKDEMMDEMEEVMVMAMMIQMITIIIMKQGIVRGTRKGMMTAMLLVSTNMKKQKNVTMMIGETHSFEIQSPTVVLNGC